MQATDSSKKSQPKILNNIYEKLVKLGEGSGGKVYLCKMMSRQQPKSHYQFFFTNTKLDATNQADSLKLNQETSGQEGKHYLAIKQFKNASCLVRNIKQTFHQKKLVCCYSSFATCSSQYWASFSCRPSLHVSQIVVHRTRTGQKWGPKPRFNQRNQINEAALSPERHGSKLVLWEPVSRSYLPLLSFFVEYALIFRPLNPNAQHTFSPR